jgi:nitroreductase
MIGQTAKNIIFTDARSHNGWLNKDVPESKISELYNLLKFGPTSANCCPARFTFLSSPEAKDRLKPCLPPANHKVLDAPFVAIISLDNEFHNHLPFLFPHDDAKSWFEGNPEKILETAKLNSALQASYFMMAARSVGLDCGPISGFNKLETDKEFHDSDNYSSFMICALGYGDHGEVHPRSPRFDFHQVCNIL